MPERIRNRFANEIWSLWSADWLIFLVALFLALEASNAAAGVIRQAWTNPVDVLFVVGFSISLIAVNSAIGMYRRDLKVSEAAIARALGAAALDTVIFYVAIRALTPALASPAQTPFPLLVYALLVASLRPLLFALHHSGVGQRRILILGCGFDALAVQERLATNRQQHIKVVGVLPAGEEVSHHVQGLPVFDRDADLWDLVSRLKVTEVIVAAREQRGGVLPLRGLLECRIHGVRITDQTAFFERVHGEFPLESLKASWLIYGHGFEQHLGRRFAKRCTDLIASLVLLLLTLPIMALAAIAIKMEGAGPVLYRQERVGRGGRIFQVLKFRSMRVDAEGYGVARWAGASDSRITRVGRFMRKTRIDELPQLFNVLRGEMSIVGPRPERPSFVDQLKRDVRFYDVRHSINPGLTGWAQVRFSYAASLEDSRRKLQYDLYYVKNHSLVLDLRILAETVRVVLRGEGAR